MQDMYHKYFEDFKLDETCRSSGRQMTEADTRISIGVIGGSHPLHIDPEYCASRPDVGRPIYIGDIINCEFQVKGVSDFNDRYGQVTVAATVYNQEKVPVTFALEHFLVEKEGGR